MKKILYYLPIIILVIYLIYFPFLQKKIVVLTTPSGEDYFEAINMAYGVGEYHIERNVFWSNKTTRDDNKSY